MKIESILKTDKQLPQHKRAAIGILYTQNLFTDGFSNILKPFDLSGEQFNVLRILRGHGDQPANMSCIQERMIAKTSNTTRLVDKLLAKDLVTREICPNNRRKMEVGITQKGLDLLTRVDPVVENYEQAFFKNLSAADIETLNSLLQKIRT